MATDDADKFQDLAASLAQFTGTTRYYRISPGHLLTDGTRYLADTAGCYWIMDAVPNLFPQRSAPCAQLGVELDKRAEVQLGQISCYSIITMRSVYNGVVILFVFICG